MAVRTPPRKWCCIPAWATCASASTTTRPIHAANFLLLSRKGVFDESVFNRVVKGLVIQGGGSEQRTIAMRSYRLPPEIRPQHFHKRGALAMARYDGEMNPDRLSSNNDFYIVQGEKMTAGPGPGHRRPAPHARAGQHLRHHRAACPASTASTRYSGKWWRASTSSTK